MRILKLFLSFFLFNNYLGRFFNLKFMYNMHDIYLSMTTRPERLVSELFKNVLNRLENQTVPFKKLVINLSVKQFTYTIPDYISNHDRIILNETRICGPCAKLLGAVKIIPSNSLVIVLDDDILMKENFIKSLYTSYLLNPDKVTSHFIEKRKKFTDIIGYAGYIFRVDLLKDIRKFYNTQPKCCVKIDDTWLGFCIKKLGVEVVRAAEPDPWLNIVDMQLSNDHASWYELCKHTDREQLTKKGLKILEARF